MIIEHEVTRPLIIPSATSLDWTDTVAVGHALLALTYELVDDLFGTLLAMSSNGVVKVISGARWIGNERIVEELAVMQRQVGEVAIVSGMWVSRTDDDHHHVHGDPFASTYQMLFWVGTDPRTTHAFTIQRKP